MQVDESSRIDLHDWVRFVRDGRLVIGEVMYCRPGGELVTDAGTVQFGDVLEVRHASR